MTIISLIKTRAVILKERFNKNIKIPFYLFLGIIIYCLTVFGIHIFRNFERGKVLNPLFHHTLDFNFYYYILSMILGSWVIYKLVQYYFEFHSIEYLMVALFIYGTIVNIFLWHMFDEYFSNNAALLDNGNWVEWIRRSALELMLAGRPVFYYGILLLFFYVVRLKKWENYSRLEKFMIALLLIDQINNIILDFCMYAGWIINPLAGLEILEFFTSGTDDFIGTISWIIALLGFPVLSPITRQLQLVYLFLAYNLLRTSSLGKSRSLAISKAYWMCFALGEIALTFFQEVIGLDPGGYATRGFFSIIQILFMLGLLVILYYGPEVILITDKLIFSAKRLYTVLAQPTTVHHPKGTLSDFTNYKLRLKAYIASIPEEYRKN